MIACCLLDEGPTLARARESGLTPESFYFPANRLIFEIMLAMPTAPALDTLVAELQSRRALDSIGGMPYLMQVVGPIPTTAHANYFIQKVREKELLRCAITEASRTVEEAYGFSSGLDEFLQKATARIEAVKASSTTAADHARQASEALASRRVHASAPPKEPITRLFLAKKPIATSGNLVTLISRAKTGKTAVLGAATAAIIAAHHDRPSQDTLGFTAPHTKDAVIVIDTEQSPYDAYLCYKRSLTRAGQETDPNWLYHYSLVGYTPEQVRAAILAALDQAGPVFTLILDGVADLVNSVNDEAECNGLVTWLRGIAVKHDCPIICVIHSNESVQSGDDGRGHLGKQLIRKAESNLLLKKSGEITTVTSDKQRKAPITAADNVAFQWSDERQMHVSCATVTTETKAGRPPKYDQAAMLSCFPAPNEPGKPLNAIFRVVHDLPCTISDRAFKDWSAKWIETGEVIRTGDAKVGFGFKRGF